MINWLFDFLICILLSSSPIYSNFNDLPLTLVFLTISILVVHGNPDNTVVKCMGNYHSWSDFTVWELDVELVFESLGWNDWPHWVNIGTHLRRLGHLSQRSLERLSLPHKFQWLIIGFGKNALRSLRSFLYSMNKEAIFCEYELKEIWLIVYHLLWFLDLQLTIPCLA